MPLSRQRRFPRARRSVSTARSFAVEILTEWGIEERLDDIRLCVSELATNAVLHGVPPGREFCLCLVLDVPFVRVEVVDSGDGQPRVLDQNAEDTGGRGLFLTSALSDDFGVTSRVPGKTVWAVFKTGSVAAPAE
ncbi:ATP-binding protein [Streptomyces sp. G44]|uniref:ATP-binding protein n=1 Tax=Streptomyces sp. G44 TaxID=2807632 RepID=UPI00195FB9F3|nr:ATP-binding protein [Streptomyces sp. G44]MBM7171608.1 ATP-binding protein [Streptomyces sp. G44]